MANNIVYPSLSEDSWVGNSQRIADYLFATFFASDYSQSYIYHKKICSFAYILHVNQGDMMGTISAVRQTLSDYFSRYFNNVVVEVQEVENTVDPSKGQISIYLSFTDTTGEVFNLQKIREISNTFTDKIIEINNG